MQLLRLVLALPVAAVTARRVLQHDVLSADGSFLTAQWLSVEAELKQLQGAAAAMAARLPNQAVSDLQIGAKPGKGDAKAKVEPKAALLKKGKAVFGRNGTNTSSAANATKAPAKKSDGAAAKAPAKKDEVADLLKGADAAKLSAMMAGKKGDPIMLAPMLAMLKSLYQGGRDRISELNKREKKSKERAAQYEKQHEARMKKLEDQHKNHKMSEEMYVNATRDEARLFAYWPRCREREHQQFHNMLKLQHATMQREKMMIDMYEKAITGGEKNKAAVTKELSQVAGGLPEVVFAQQAAQVKRFCVEALEEAAAARRELATAF